MLSSEMSDSDSSDSADAAASADKNPGAMSMGFDPKESKIP